MLKVYICGLGASGKGLMKQLLDGHSEICIIPPQGFILKKLISYDFQERKQLSRGSNPYYREYSKNMPSFNLKYEGDIYRIDFDEFIRHIYYNIDLYIMSRAKRISGGAGPNIENSSEFIFDYFQYERDWFNALFVNQNTLSIEDFLNTMYKHLIINWQNKVVNYENVKAIANPVQNGIMPIKWLLKNTNNSKFILMDRNGIEFSYAIANRRASSIIDKGFYKHLFNLSIIKLKKEYKEYIRKSAIKLDSRVLIVDFKSLVLNTKETMKKTADFLGIEYESILTKATLNGISLESDNVKFTGKINEDPYDALPRNTIDFLKYLYDGPNQNTSIWKKGYLYSKASKEKVSYNINWLRQRLLRLLELVKK